MAKLKFISKCPNRNFRTSTAEVVVYQIVNAHQAFIDEVAPIVKGHYLSESSIIKILKKWGRKKLATYIRQSLPVTKKGRSGHLGEILVTEYVNRIDLGYEVPIKRLRWKDGRDCAMRGEDILGFAFDQKPMGFLKGESKSRRALTSAVIDEARKGLEKNSGLPQSHTLMFIAERLTEMGQDKKAEQIQEYVVGKIPDKTQVAHLIFTFSGNDPFIMLKADAKNVKKGMKHYSIGLFVKEHQETVKDVFKKAQHV